MSKEIRDGKTVWWLYQARRVNTQTNAGGGALYTRITLPSGVVAKLVSMAVRQATAGAQILAIDVLDEDGATLPSAANFGSVGAAANNSLFLPSVGTAANASTNLTNTVGFILGPGMTIRVVGGGAAQNETQTVYIALLASAPIAATITWDTTGSAGTPSLAASTISTANTEQAVVM